MRDMETKDSAKRRLKTVLRANAAFSFVSAVVFISFTDWIAVVTGISNSPGIQQTGFSLVGFAAFLLLVAGLGERLLRSPVIWGIVAADYIWVVVSIVGLFVWSDVLTTMGIYVVADIALIVGVLASLQALYFLKWQRSIVVGNL